METLKQQFNSHSSEAVVHLRGRQRTLGAKDIRHRIERSRGWAALMAAVCVGEAQAGIPGCVSASERPMQRVEPTPPRLRRTGLSDASKAGEPAYPSAFDPVGRYELTMSSETMVSEGTMEIRGEPGRYTGMIAVGSVGARIVGVEAAADHMIVRATTSERTLILRLARDEDFFSGNWILGGQRGTIVGRKRPDQSSAGPVSIGRSFRPPHSDQDPS